MNLQILGKCTPHWLLHLIQESLTNRTCKAEKCQLPISGTYSTSYFASFDSLVHFKAWPSLLSVASSFLCDIVKARIVSTVLHPNTTVWALGFAFRLIRACSCAKKTPKEATHWCK